MVSKITRREFLKILGGTGLAFFLPRWLTWPQVLTSSSGSTIDDLIVAEGKNPQATTLAAISAFGGMEKIVHPGEIVLIKPNIAWDRTPEQAANTNPEVVAALVKSCLAAGAKKVKVFERTINYAPMTYEKSGIAAAARKAGAEISFFDQERCREVKIPRGKALSSWPLCEEILEADRVINVPIAKVHSLTTLTLGIKNVLGMVGGNRSILHYPIHQNLADLNSVIKIDLTVMDATRIMISNGPQGGSLEDVVWKGQIIVSRDRVAVDAYTTTLFGLEPRDIEYISLAHEMGLGEMDLQKIKIKKVRVETAKTLVFYHA